MIAKVSLSFEINEVKDFPLECLPNELINEIVKNLDFDSLKNFSGVSKRIYTIITSSTHKNVTEFYKNILTNAINNTADFDKIDEIICRNNINAIDLFNGFSAAINKSRPEIFSLFFKNNNFDLLTFTKKFEDRQKGLHFLKLVAGHFEIVDGFSFLAWASGKGLLEIVKELLKLDSTGPYELESALKAAFRHYHPEIINELLKLPIMLTYESEIIKKCILHEEELVIEFNKNVNRRISFCNTLNELRVVDAQRKFNKFRSFSNFPFLNKILKDLINRDEFIRNFYKKDAEVTGYSQDFDDLAIIAAGENLSIEIAKKFLSNNQYSISTLENFLMSINTYKEATALLNLKRENPFVEADIESLNGQRYRCFNIINKILFFDEEMIQEFEKNIKIRLNEYKTLKEQEEIEAEIEYKEFITNSKCSLL